MASKPAFIVCSCKSKTSASKLASFLLKNKKAACVSYFPVESQYTWKNKAHKGKEYIVFVKTVTKYFEEVKKAAEELSGYEVPEVLCLGVDLISESYLAWMKSVL